MKQLFQKGTAQRFFSEDSVLARILQLDTQGSFTKGEWQDDRAASETEVDV
jgi:hypothetical protein